MRAQPPAHDPDDPCLQLAKFGLEKPICAIAADRQRAHRASLSPTLRERKGARGTGARSWDARAAAGRARPAQAGAVASPPVPRVTRGVGPASVQRIRRKPSSSWIPRPGRLRIASESQLSSITASPSPRPGLARARPIPQPLVGHQDRQLAGAGAAGDVDVAAAAPSAGPPRSRRGRRRWSRPRRRPGRSGRGRALGLPRRQPSGRRRDVQPEPSPGRRRGTGRAAAPRLRVLATPPFVAPSPNITRIWYP